MTQPIKVKKSVTDGAEKHLLHKYNRPYYFGIDDLCDAATENAEQFLHLSSVLVDMMQTRLIRQHDASLPAENQHKLLRTRSQELTRIIHEYYRALACSFACNKSLVGRPYAQLRTSFSESVVNKCPA